MQELREQKQFLTKVLQTKNYELITNNNLSDKYFSDFKAEFNYIKEYYDKYKTIPDIGTFDSIFPEYGIKNQEPVAEPDSYLLDEIYDNYYKEFSAEQFEKVRTLLESGTADSGSKALELLRQIGDEASKVEVSTTDTYVDITQDFSRYDRYKERALNPDASYLSTGFHELDELTGGIDLLNENMVIAAKTGVGKSWILDAMLANAYLSGRRVGLYSGEMHEDKVGYRVDTILGGLSNKALNRGFISEETAYVKYLEKLKHGKLIKDNKEGHIFVQTPAMLKKDRGATVADLKKFIEDANLDILFIDQYSLLDDEGSKNRAEHEQVSNIAKGVKNLQVLKQIPIISVSQLHRDGKKREEIEDESELQDAESMALSYRISQDATTIIMLSKKPIDPNTNLPVKKMETGVRYSKFLFTLNITKARDGGEGKLTYAIDLDTFDCTYFDKNNADTRSDEHSDSAEYLEDCDPDTGEILDDEEDNAEYMLPTRN